VAHDSTVDCRLYLKEGSMFFSRSCSEALVFEFRTKLLLCLITSCLDRCLWQAGRFNHNSSTTVIGSVGATFFLILVA